MTAQSSSRSAFQERPSVNYAAPNPYGCEKKGLNDGMVTAKQGLAELR